MEPPGSHVRDPYHSKSLPYHDHHSSGTHRYAEPLPNQSYLSRPEYFTPSLSPLPDASPPPFLSRHTASIYSHSYPLYSPQDESFSPDVSTSPSRVSQERDSRSWKSTVSEKQKSKKHRKNGKEDIASEKETEPSISFVHQMIEQNRGNLLNLALQQNGCR